MTDGKIIRNKLIGNDNERAVSPVIGVILMVAITVILAAVIAAFVMDLGDMSGSANAGIDFDESGDDITVQVIDEGNTDSIYVQVEAEAEEGYLDSTGGDVGEFEESWSVGNSVTINGAAVGDGDDLEDASNNDFTNDEEIDSITVYGEIDGDQQVVATWSN